MTTPTEGGAVVEPTSTSAAASVTLRTSSAEATRALGSAFAGILCAGDVVLVAGELGAGKTTFVQGVAAGLGVADHVTSPTFTLVRPYACDAPRDDRVVDGAPVRVLLHADLYRLDRLAEVVDLALGELVEEEAVAVVEWGDVAEPVLGRHALRVALRSGSTEDERLVTVDAEGIAEPRRTDIDARMRAWTDDNRPVDTNFPGTTATRVR